MRLKAFPNDKYRFQFYINVDKLTGEQIKAKTGCKAYINLAYFNMNKYAKAKTPQDVYDSTESGLMVNGREIGKIRYHEWGACIDEDGNLVMAVPTGQRNYAVGLPPQVIDGKRYASARDYPKDGCTYIGFKADGTPVWGIAIEDEPLSSDEAIVEMAKAGCVHILRYDGSWSSQGDFGDGPIKPSQRRIVQSWLLAFEREKDYGHTIIEPVYVWNNALVRRAKTEIIVLHHSAGKGSAEDVHAYHSQREGWAGIAYNYYIRQDGSIYRGRPEWAAGAHTEGFNTRSIGICFEGNFEVENMSEKQLEAGIWLIKDILTRYNVPIAPHKNFANTACPGRNFPLARMMALAPPTAPKTVTVELPMLSKGSKGSAVKTVQRLLIVLGYNPGGADGDFGARTQAGVREYQARNGLTADGVVGKLTWEKLLK